VTDTPDLPGDVVEVWTIGCDISRHSGTALAATLTDAELTRLAGFRRWSDRRTFLVAHGAARTILGRRLALPPRTVPIHTDHNGKPRTDGLQFSLSHAGDYVMIAVTTGRDVGIDLERAEADRPVQRLAARFFPPDEADLVARHPPSYLRLWTRKEACVKAAGARLGQGLGLVVHGDPRRPITDPSGRLPGSFLAQDLAAPAGYTASVALSGSAPYRVSYRGWPFPDGAASRAEPLPT
jgi:4'-phosphopantetheinyl transferase